MKYISKILMLLLAIGLVTSCQDDEWASRNQEEPQIGVFGNEMKLCLNFVAPDPVVAGTRAVDPDGKTLQTLHLFCFDANGLFLTTATADVKGNPKDDNLSGTFSATIPKTTRIIHLLANQNLSIFDRDAYVFKTEDDVLSALEGSAGMMIYWARIQAPMNVRELYTDAQYSLNEDGKTINERTDAEAFVDWITIETNPETNQHRGVSGKNNPIIFLRNQAKFSIVSELEGSEGEQTDKWKGTYFEVTGFTVCNTPAFGTVAPYNTQHGFPTYTCETYVADFPVTDYNEDEILYTNWLDEKKVTLAARRDKMSDIADVSTQREFYVFETSNLGTDPVDLILKGSNIVNGEKQEERYYYRVNILNEEGELVEILRNHHYEIHISGNLNNGCLTFDEALVAPPTNNIWLSISDEVNSVRNNYYELSVDKTKVIVEADANGEPELRDLKLNFDIKALTSEKDVDPKKIKIYWVEEEQKVSNTFFTSTDENGYIDGRKVTYDEATGEGVITLALNKLVPGSEYERGSVVVKYGNLQRKIRVLLMRTKQFVPSWVSSEVYGTVTGDTESRSNVAIIFTIPETCPDELFPMDVLITTNGLDGRAATGQILPIVREGEEGYGKSFTTKAPDDSVVTDIGYKYKFTVTEPGQHRLYFENIVSMENKTVEYVTLEAEYFDLITKMVTYVDHKNEIVMPYLAEYSFNQGASEEEKIKYMLVPQKRFSPVVFDISLNVDGSPFGTLSNEEFLLYSTNLDHYPDDEQRLPENSQSAGIYGNGFVTTDFSRSDFDCYFKPYSREYWSTGGRIFGFYFREDKVSGTVPGLLDANNCFQIYLETNKPKSAEIVRVASNQILSKSVINDRFLYIGKTFRSVTFELANYRPFRFAAQINGEGDYVADDATSGTQNPEVVNDIQFEYLPDDVVAISFDVTSFHTNDINGNLVSVDPFGTAFEIFIDAPMLKIEYGMNKDAVFGDKFEDVLVEMFDKDAEGNPVTNYKPKLEDLGNGRFVYRVDAMYAYERGFWMGHYPKIRDEKAGMLVNGDRKTLYFKKNSIVSNGEITISANPDHVTYHSKTFKVSNSPIVGRIKYRLEEEGQAPRELQVPHAQFVSFARKYDGSRIGSMNVLGDENDPSVETEYNLRLRAEYDFNWTNDPIVITSSIGGVYYSATVADLQTLYANPDIVLVKMDEE